MRSSKQYEGWDGEGGPRKGKMGGKMEKGRKKEVEIAWERGEG